MSYRFLVYVFFKAGKLSFLIWQPLIWLLFSFNAYTQVSDTVSIFPPAIDTVADTFPAAASADTTTAPSPAPAPASAAATATNAVDFLKVINRTNDSTVFIPYNKTNGYNRNIRIQQFYDSLRIKAKNKRFTKELYNAFFTDTIKKVSNRRILNPESFKIYEHRIIRSITLKQLDVFGPTIADTSKTTNSRVNKLGNKIHINTRERIIRQSLMVKKGDPLNPFLMFENERLIRDLPYIEDARFLIKEVENNPDSVDIILVVKDVWPIAFEVALNGLDAGEFSLWYRNTFGMGHQIETKLYWDVSMDNILGTGISYSIPNLLGSYITTDLLYIDRWNTKTYRVDIHRNFMAANINWAGALRLENTETVENIPLRDTTIAEVKFKYLYYNFWLGKSFEINTLNGIRPTRTNFYVAARFLQNDYLQSPETAENYLYRFQDKKLWLLSFGFSRQGFTRSSLIYSFGRTEDVPFGYLLNITIGSEIGQYRNRPYVGISASGGTTIRRIGYCYANAELGSFIHNNKLEQGAIRLKAKYFTDLQTLNRFQFRHFLNVEYVLGLTLNQDEYISIENRSGINGLKSTTLRGTEKTVINFESVLFTPYQLLGFRFVFFAFADLGMINGSHFPSVNSRVFSGLGLGLRFRNERLVFNTFQIKFTWYPELPEEPSYSIFTTAGEPRLRLRNFYMEEPQIIGY
jgi:hypothetical protein